MTDGLDGVWKLAAAGDSTVLAELRDGLLAVFLGKEERTGLSPGDALAQAEIIARLAACAGGVTDRVALAATLHLCAERARVDVEWGQSNAKEAVATGNKEWLFACTQTEVIATERAKGLAAEVDGLLGEIVSDDDPEGAAMIVRALLFNADRGDESAVGTLQVIFDTAPKERALAILAATRLQERLDA